MKFRTEIFPEQPNFQLSHDDHIMAVGSCFAENIGNRFKQAFFNIDVNPFGILYNPASVKQALEFIVERKCFTKSDLEYYNQKWFSFYHHGSFSFPDEKEVLLAINSRINDANDALKKAKVIFITFGTSWVYRYKESGKVVSNCHKLPAKNFDRYRLDVDEIVLEYQKIIYQLKKNNPNIKIVFTVSPVRHWKDGANGNQISKAVLLLAVEKLCDSVDVHYFPSYELVIDDLRDYRFFEDDMLHPSNVAVDYIWEKFSETYFSSTTRQLNLQLCKIHKAASHRPLFAGSESHKKFVASQIKLIDDIKKQHPNIDFYKTVQKLKYNGK